MNDRINKSSFCGELLFILRYIGLITVLTAFLSFDKIKQVKSDYEKSSNKGKCFIEKKWLVKTFNNPL